MTTKKKILFLVGNMESGGVSKSMVNLLQVIDKERYDISLWLGKRGGLYEALLPKDGVHIFLDDITDALNRGPQGFFLLIRKGRFVRAFLSALRMMLSLFNKPWAALLLSRLYPVLKEEYNVAVDYGGQQLLYYMVDRLKAEKKISFFHNDYSKWPFYYSLDKKYYRKVQHICTISQTCLDSLAHFFPLCAAKMSIIPNIVAPNVVEALSEEEVSDMDQQNVTFVTVGHVCKRKGSDIAIEAAAILKSKGIKFKWYFIGDTKELSLFKDKISEYRLHHELLFLGMRQNPYPYMKRATIIVHPARYEGKSIALDEAKILCKPIVVTNFSTVYDQFQNRVNASICEMTPESVSEAMLSLLSHPETMREYSQWLKNHREDNSSEVNKLYKLFEEEAKR